jgi:hypothetical protein
MRRDTGTMSDFPLPGSAPYAVAAPAPGHGPQFWAGAPCAVLDDDGTFVVGYRVRNGPDTTDQTVIARSADGETLETVLVFDQDRFGAQWTERPALVRTDTGWRLFVGCATPQTKHWFIAALDAPTLEGLASAEPRTVFPGDPLTAVKDPIVRRRQWGWEAWICCHLLDVPGEEDRMNTAYATSPDGWTWDWHSTVLEGRPGEWDARGARLTTILPDGRAAYDGRASAEENWFEQIGLATPGERYTYVANGGPKFDARYLEALPLPGGGYRIYYEARLEDESHELRTELIV